MFDVLENIGIYLDELNCLRLLDPDVAGMTNELKNELRHFVDSKSAITSYTFTLHTREMCSRIDMQTHAGLHPGPCPSQRLKP